MLPNIFPISKEVHPKTPDFSSKVESICIDVLGVKVSFKLPLHKSTYNKEQTPKIKVDEDDFVLCKDIHTPEKNYRISILFARSCLLKGPWYHSEIGELGLTCAVVKKDITGAKDSFFNKVAFEQCLLDQMFQQWGSSESDFSHGKQMNLAPINWQVERVNGANGISYEVHRCGNVSNLFEACFPLTGDSYLYLSLTNGALYLKDKNDKELINDGAVRSYFKQLIEQIVIESSSQTRENRGIVESLFPDQKFSAKREPAKWTTEEQDKEYDEHQKWWSELVELSKLSTEETK